MQDTLYLTDKERDKDAYYKATMDFIISSCDEQSKKELTKAYLIRNGQRDTAEFQYLWEAYGMEFPSKLRHIPVLKSMFDVLSGQELTAPLIYKISCRNNKAIDYIGKKQKENILRELKVKFIHHIKDRIEYFRKLQTNPNLPRPKETLTDAALDEMEKAHNRYFRTEIEIYAQDLIEYFLQSKELKMKFNTMWEDLVTGGQQYYQVKVEQIGIDPVDKVINPVGLYYPRNNNVRYIRELDKVVYKEEMAPVDIIHKFGEFMDKTDLEEFRSQYAKHLSEGYLLRHGKELDQVASKKNDKSTMREMTVPVYYVEWKENTKIEYEENELLFEGVEAKRIAKGKRSKYRLDRYEGYRIGDKIYCKYGKSKYVTRPLDDPGNCYLSINGACYNDRNGDPFSLVLNTKDIADKIDILHYHAENMISASGNKAVWINFPDIPSFITGTPMRRLMKWMGYLKQGVGVIDTSMEGHSGGKFNNYGSMDLSMNQSVAVLYQIIEALESTASRITGVNRQTLGDIRSGDLNGTTDKAIANSTLVTTPLFAIHNSVVKMYLTDLLNASRIAFREGKRGSYILGDYGQKLFTIDGDKMQLAEYDVHVSDSGQEIQKLQQYQALASEFISNGALDPLAAIDMFASTSLSEVKQKLGENLGNVKDQSIAELQQKLKEYEEAMNKMQAEVQKFNAEEIQIKAQKNQIDAQRLNFEDTWKQRELDLREKEGGDKKETEDARIELEAAELKMSEGNQKEVRN